MAMEENLALRSEENSQCFPRHRVRKASLPSMRSQLMSGSGSVVLCRGEEVPTCGGWRRTTRNAWSGSEEGREEAQIVDGGGGLLNVLVGLLDVGSSLPVNVGY